MKRYLHILIFFLALLLVDNSWGQLAIWNPAWSGITASPLAASSLGANVASGSLARVNLTGTSSSSRFSSNTWNNTSDYLTITVTPNGSYLLNMNSQAVILNMGSSATGPDQYYLYSSVDGYVSLLGTFPTSCTTQNGNVSVTLPATGFNGLSSITFRVVGDQTGCSSTLGAAGTGGPSYIEIDGTAVSNCPTYAALPYTQDFEAWVADPCSGGAARVPDTHWESSVAGSGGVTDYWHRYDYSGTGDWSALLDATGQYSPTFSHGSYSARFRNRSSTGGTQGILDLFVDFSTVGTKTITFDYSHNETWTSAYAFDVLLSTDGGVTFPTSLLHIGSGTGALTFGGAGSTQTISTAAVSGTSVLRFRVTDKGIVDVGIDNLSISVASCAAAAQPYSENFDGAVTPALPACWTYIDNDNGGVGDGNHWQTDNSSSTFPPPSGGSSPNAMFCEYDASHPNDDWAFSKGVTLATATTYTVSFIYAAFSSSYTEKLVLACGTSQTIAGMTTTIYTNAGFSNTAYATQTSTFTVPVAGTYYFGFHDYSATNQYGIFVDNVSLIAPTAQTITTGVIAGAGYPTFCAGETPISVPYTITGAYTAGNVFTAQLSDAIGSFGSPTNIGTLTSQVAGTITATIPAAAVSGTLYRIRVVSSTPAVVGSANGVNLTINALPMAAGTISGLGSVCQGQNGVAYSVPTIPNATSYTWAYTGGGATIVGATNAITINFAGIATSGNLTVYGVDACGNGTISANYPITANPMPIITTNPTNTSVGIGVNAYFGVVTSAGSPTYQWQMSSDNVTWVNVANGTPAGVTYTNPTTPTLTANGTSVLALYYYRCVVTAAGCSANSNSATLTVTNPCVTPINAFPWTENFDAMSTLGTDIVPNCWLTQPTGVWTSSTGSGYNSPCSVPNYVDVNYYPYTGIDKYLITPAFTLTAGNTYNFGFKWVGDGYKGWNAEVRYNTTQTGTGSTLLGSAFLTSGTTTGTTCVANTQAFTPGVTGTYYFMVHVTNNITPYFLGFDDFSVTVPCLAPTITLGANPAVCRGTTAASLPYTATTNAPTKYSITYDATALAAGFANVALTALPASPIPITVPAAAAASTYNGTVTVQTAGGCSSTSTVPFTVTVNPFPSASGGITGTPTVCQGQNGVAFSVGAITNATGYIWTYTGAGFSIASGGGTNSITANFAVGATAGTLTVTGTNTCGSGTTSSAYAIAVNPLPAAAGVITGTAAPCTGSNGVGYSVGAITNATSYTWSYSGAGATIIGSSNAITINFSGAATSGNLTVLGVDACGNGSVSANYVITIGASTAPSAGPDQYLCASPATMAANIIAGASWTKVSGGAATITNAALATTTITGLVSGTYVFRWTNSCGAYDDVVVVVQ